MQESIQKIVSSKLMEKRVLVYGDQVHIIAIFEASNYYNFFITFTAPKPNSPIEKWTFKTAEPIYQGAYINMDDMQNNMMARYFRGKMAWITTKAFCTPAEMERLRESIIHPKRQPIPEGATFNIVERKSLSGQRRSPGFVYSRNPSKGRVRF